MISTTRRVSISHFETLDVVYYRAVAVYCRAHSGYHLL